MGFGSSLGGSDDGQRRVNNPKDFTTLQAENVDIFGWITVPGTDVDTPIAQNLDDDLFYIDHGISKEYDLSGVPFMQQKNPVDMTGPVSVIYGHNLTDGSQFTTLHYFENEDFFKEHEEFTIYIPGHILTYNIISAYIYDDRHILNSYNFEDSSVLQSYFDFVCKPDTLIANVRTDKDGNNLTLDAANDRIVQLSTCMSDILRLAQRYIVTGVLVKDQLTY